MKTITNLCFRKSSGRTVLQQMLPMNQGKAAIHPGDLSGGIYILKMSMGDQEYHQKFMFNP